MNASLVSHGWTWTLEPSCISDKKLLLFCLPAANVVWHEGNEGAWLMAQAQHVLSCESRQFLPITVQDHFDHKKKQSRIIDGCMQMTLGHRQTIYRTMHIGLVIYGPDWHSSQQLMKLLCACFFFFFCQTLISKTTFWVKLFFSSSHKDMGWDESENSSLCQLFPSWAVGEVILPNTFFQSSSASLIELSCVKQALYIIKIQKVAFLFECVLMVRSDEGWYVFDAQQHKTLWPPSPDDS